MTSDKNTTSSRRKPGKERKADRRAVHDVTFYLLRAIAAKCRDCSGGSRCAVAECHLDRCPLHRYRMGLDAPQPA